MNINKEEMSIAFDRRNETFYKNKLIHFFNQMSNYFANKFAIRYESREDIKQEAMIVAFKALDKYDKSKNSTPFSYFYKVFHIAFLYHLRKQKMKKDHSVHTCSIDLLPNEGEDVTQYKNDEEYITYDGNIFEKEDLIKKIKKASYLAKKIIKVDDIEAKKMMNEIEDNFIKNFVIKYIEKRRKK